MLGINGECIHGGVGAWSLPVNGKPGDWMPQLTGKLVPCSYGYHVLTFEQLVIWLGPTIWRIEISGRPLLDGDTHIVARARLLSRIAQWTEKTARLFAADCAEHVLPIFEKQYPHDNRPANAIKAARRYANLTIGNEERAAARNAARYAAWGSHGDIIWAAKVGGVWDAAIAAAEAAGEAAAAAAGDAASGIAAAAVWAARIAAGQSEQKWQVTKLQEYLINE